MHHVDFAEQIVREIDETLKATDAVILGGNVSDWIGYQKASARRAALLEVRGIITSTLGRDEAR